MPTTKSRPAVLEILAASGPGAPSTEEKLRVVSKMRRDQPEMSPQLDGFLIEQAAGSRAEARETKAYAKELETVVEQLTAPPQIAAIYLGPVKSPGGGAAVVVHNNARRVVRLASTVDPDCRGPRRASGGGRSHPALGAGPGRLARRTHSDRPVRRDRLRSRERAGGGEAPPSPHRGPETGARLRSGGQGERQPGTGASGSALPPPGSPGAAPCGAERAASRPAAAKNISRLVRYIAISY